MHIVVFTGGDFPKPELEKNYFSESHIEGCESSFFPDYVIAADSGLSVCECYKSYFGNSFEPDLILGDMDSICDKKMLESYPAEKIEKFIEDKDYTDTELALEKAHGKNADFITLVGAGGGSRIDHLLGVFDLFATNIRPDAWLAGDQTLYYFPEGVSCSLRCLALRDVISIARTSTNRTGGHLFSKGLLWEYNTFRKEGMPSISNRISPEYFEQKKDVLITAEKGDFVLISPASALVYRRKS